MKNLLLISIVTTTVGIITYLYNKSNSLNDFITLLNTTDMNTKVYINYKKVNDPSKIITVLKKIKKPSNLKSSPYDGGYWKIEIENTKNNIVLGIKKGSYYKNEYWIYKKISDPHYAKPFYEEVGTVKTNIFDQYIN